MEHVCRVLTFCDIPRQKKKTNQTVYAEPESFCRNPISCLSFKGATVIPSRTKPNLFYLKDPSRTAQWTLSSSVIKTNLLKYWAKVAGRSDIHTVNTQMLCVQNILVFDNILAATQIRPTALSGASRSQIKGRCKIKQKKHESLWCVWHFDSLIKWRHTYMLSFLHELQFSTVAHPMALISNQVFIILCNCILPPFMPYSSNWENNVNPTITSEKKGSDKSSLRLATLVGSQRSVSLL